MLRLFRALMSVGLLSLLFAGLVAGTAPSRPVHAAPVPGACPAPVFGAASNFPVNSFPRGVAVGDFNNDGKLDLVTANGGASTLSVLLGSGAGTFGPATNYPVGTTPISVVVGDLDADGHPDLVSENIGSNTVTVLLGSGTGSFGAATSYPVGLQVKVRRFCWSYQPCEPVHRLCSDDGWRPDQAQVLR